MPKKKNTLSEEERRKRLRQAARELETSNDPKKFEEAFKKITSQKPRESDGGP